MSDIVNFDGSAVQAAQENTTTTEMMISRQSQEVQVAMLAAKRFPRDIITAYNRIMETCKRTSLAEKSLYEYPRGGESVTGPSIRLAEAIAQNWGNLDFGTIELERRPGESTAMSYCWDLETNTRQTMTFTVPHLRETRRGKTVLTDSRDIYELVANQGSRRRRACILGVIPGDVTEAAIRQCNLTLSGKSSEPIQDRVRKMASAFQEGFGVPLASLEKYIGVRSESFTEQSIVRLRKVFTSLKDGMSSVEQYFDLSIVPEAEPDADRSAGDKSETGPAAGQVNMDEL